MSCPSKSYDRREFPVRASALLGAGVTAACENGPLVRVLREASNAGGIGAEAATIHLFANESGRFAGRDPFVVGLVPAAAPDAHETALADLRAALGHFTELRYGGTDRFEEEYAEAGWTISPTATT